RARRHHRQPALRGLVRRHPVRARRGAVERLVGPDAAQPRPRHRRALPVVPADPRGAQRVGPVPRHPRGARRDGRPGRRAAHPPAGLRVRRAEGGGRVILGAMSTWTTTPGRVLHVRPTAEAAAAAASAPVDAGPPSFLQGDHLRAYAARRAAGGVHRAWTGVASHLTGPFDGAALARALTRFVRRHEGLRTWFDVDGAEPVRHLVPADVVAFETVEVPGPEAGPAWDEALTAHLTATFDAAGRPDSWAPFALGVVVPAPDAGGSDAGFGVFWGCDHAFTDGASQLMVLSELEELYAQELADAAPDAGPAGSFLDHARAEHALAAGTPPDAP